MELQRLARLSDVIFAVAMTLMALTFDPLPTAKMTFQDITAFLQAQLPSFGAYALTFLVIAFYWASHIHQFKYYQRTDSIHLSLVLLSLLFVVFLPYANDLLTFYDSVLAVQVFYSLAAGGIGIFNAGTWIYATYNRQLVDPQLSDQTIRDIRRESYVEPAILLLAIGGAWIHPSGWLITIVAGFSLVFLIQFLFQSPKTKSKPNEGENSFV